MDNPLERFKIARGLGKLALLRLRADCLLQYADEGRIILTSDERERIDRIGTVPNLDDADFLDTFDDRLSRPAGLGP